MRFSTEQLEALLSDLESARAERTVSKDKTDKFGEAMCAFANDLSASGQPGYLFVGVKDDGTPSGLPITEELLQRLAAIRSDGNLLPPPVVNVEKLSLRGAELAVVEVIPSELPPVRYKGEVWVRIGPRRARATAADERVLAEKRSALAKTWDARPCHQAELADLMLQLFESYRMQAVDPAVVSENGRGIEEQLAALRFLDRRATRPTNAAVLLFGKDPLQAGLGAYVQYVHYDGPTAASPVLVERRFQADLFSVLRELGSLAEELARSRPVSVGPLQERQVSDFPAAALREVFVNAIVHRDYESNSPVMINHFSDRLEVMNPGGLYGDVRPEDFPGATAYRNPVLAEAAKTLGFVNRFGRGVPRIVEAMANNGSPAARFEPTARHFLVVLPKRP